MNEPDQVLTALAATQHQVFSRAQACQAGLPASTLHSRVRAGTLVECGVKALHYAGVTLTTRGELMAGLLDLGPQALVSGAAAAHVHGLDGFDGLDGFELGRREFLVPRAQRRRRTLGTVRSLDGIEPLDRVVLDGLACTSATMTVVQLLATATLEQAANALDSACRMRLTAVPVVARRLDALGRQGRAGVALFEQIIAEAVVDSWLERRFVKLLRDAALPIPTAQRRHRLAGVGVVRVDFEFDQLPIVIEVGGRLGYLSGGERDRKERRRNAVQLTGRTIYFFARNHVVHDPAYVVATVTAAVARADPGTRLGKSDHTGSDVPRSRRRSRDGPAFTRSARHGPTPGGAARRRRHAPRHPSRRHRRRSRRLCGRTVDIDCTVGSAPCLEASDPAGFGIDEAEVIYWGRCPECRAGADPATGDETTTRPRR